MPVCEPASEADGGVGRGPGVRPTKTARADGGGVVYTRGFAWGDLDSNFNLSQTGSRLPMVTINL